MMRIVLDSAVSLVISPDILDEAYRVMRYPKLVRLMEKSSLASEEVDSFIEKLSKIAIVSPGEFTLEVIQNDPPDNEIVACAVEGEADFIISGDHHLFDFNEFQGIMIINPATFLAIVSLERPPDS